MVINFNLKVAQFFGEFLGYFGNHHFLNETLVVQSHLYQGRTSMHIILARMHSFSDVMQGWLDFSSIYIIGQLLQL